MHGFVMCSAALPRAHSSPHQPHQPHPPIRYHPLAAGTPPPWCASTRLACWYWQPFRHGGWSCSRGAGATPPALQPAPPPLLCCCPPQAAKYWLVGAYMLASKMCTVELTLVSKKM